MNDNLIISNSKLSSVNLVALIIKFELFIGEGRSCWCVLYDGKDDHCELLDKFKQCEILSPQHPREC